MPVRVCVPPTVSEPPPPSPLPLQLLLLLLLLLLFGVFFAPGLAVTRQVSRPSQCSPERGKLTGGAAARARDGESCQVKCENMLPLSWGGTERWWCGEGVQVSSRIIP